MLIYIQNELLDFDNDQNQTEKILKTINVKLEKMELNCSYLIIDGTPLHEDFYNYINNNIANIKKIEVVTQTLNELVDETIGSTNDYIRDAIPLITELAEAFYQQPDGETWLKLNDLFVGIQWIIETISKIDSIRNLDQIISNYEVWNEYVQEAAQLSTIVSELEASVVGKDHVSIGDILMYEICPVYEKITPKLSLLLSKEDNCVS
jgi:hypothetical protein